MDKLLNGASRRLRFERLNKKTIEIHEVFQKLKILDQSVFQNKNQLHDNYLSRRLQSVGLWTHFKGVQPRSLPEGNGPVWRSGNIIWESEDGFFSSRETNCETIARDACDPISKLLIKDNKKINNKGEFPNRLVIPEKNFTATFSKIGYIGITKMLGKGKMNYSHVSIFQASYIK